MRKDYSKDLDFVTFAKVLDAYMAKARYERELVDYYGKPALGRFLSRRPRDPMRGMSESQLRELVSRAFCEQFPNVRDYVFGMDKLSFSQRFMDFHPSVDGDHRFSFSVSDAKRHISNYEHYELRKGYGMVFQYQHDEDPVQEVANRNLAHRVSMDNRMTWEPFASFYKDVDLFLSNEIFNRMSNHPGESLSGSVDASFVRKYAGTVAVMDIVRSSEVPISSSYYSKPSGFRSDADAIQQRREKAAKRYRELMMNERRRKELGNKILEVKSVLEKLKLFKDASYCQGIIEGAAAKYKPSGVLPVRTEKGDRFVLTYGEFEYEQYKGGYESSSNRVYCEEYDRVTGVKLEEYPMVSNSYGKFICGPHAFYDSEGRLEKYREDAVVADEDLVSEELVYGSDGILKELSSDSIMSDFSLLFKRSGSLFEDFLQEYHCAPSSDSNYLSRLISFLSGRIGKMEKQLESFTPSKGLKR